MINEQIYQEFKQIFSKLDLPKNFTIKLPPLVSTELESNFTEYKKNKSLTAEFTVQKKHSNPMGVLQGGVLVAMFDNVIGPLSYLVGKNPATTLDITTSFMRSAKPDETITITATIKSIGLKVIFINAEAFNQKGKLMATCSSNILILKR